jgi:hypothetical protein
VAGNVSIQLQGALSTKPAASCGVGSGGTTGPNFVLSLATANRSATQLTSATSQTIDSPAAFEVLPIPTNQRSTLIYLRGQDLAPLRVRLTFEVSATIEVPLGGNGNLMQEFPTDDRVVTVAVQGQGRIEWLASGAIV